LDERLVEFGTAVHDSDFGRAILYLESLEDSDDHQYEVDGMWQNLSDIGLQLMNLPVAARCLAGVGDYCKAWYLQETYKLAEKFAQENSKYNQIIYYLSLLKLPFGFQLFMYP